MADDPPRPDSETALRSFLIADVRGYTRYTREHGDEAASQLAARFAGIVRETAAALGGELLELRGDEALCVFASARRAVRAAVELQRRLREPSDDGAALPLGVGIGIDAGEAVPTEGGYRGSALNLAARMCAIAAPGQILTSQGLVHLAGHVDGITFGQPRHVSLKGMGNRVSVVEVLPDQPLPPLPAAPPPERRQRRRPPAWLLVVAAVLVMAVVGAAAVLISRHGDGVATAPMSIAEIDPRSGQVLAVVPLQSAPDQIAAGGGALWVGEENGTLVRVDTSSMEVENVASPVPPTALAFGDDTLWIYDADSARLGTVDPSGVTPTQSSAAPRCPFTGVQECRGGGLSVGEGAVWVGHGYGGGAAGAAIGSVWKLDPETLQTVAQVFRVPADRITTGGGSVWTFGRVAELGARIDPVAARSVRTYSLKTKYALDQPGLTYAFNHVWFVSSSEGLLFQYEPDGGTPRTVSVGAGAHDVAATPDSLWLTSSSGTISRVDPFSSQVVTTRDLGYPSSCIAYSNGHIWVGLGSAG